MMRQHIKVRYSYESGDDTLPSLKDLVSEAPDPEKSKILKYLDTNCILGCPGVFYDEITPGRVIGAGHIYSDGTYYWNDVFANYVARYNIPVPEGFRAHLLKNYEQRMRQHLLLRLVDRVDIENNPFLGYKFSVTVCRNGNLCYCNNAEQTDKCSVLIEPEQAAYIIDPITSELFCYDSDNHGTATIEGHHWKMAFYKQDKLIKVIEGWNGEDPWRYGEAKMVLEFIERYIPYDLGSKYMAKAPEETFEL